MPRKRPAPKTKISDHQPDQALETQVAPPQVTPEPEDNEPTVGDILGQLPTPAAPHPNPTFATFADEAEELADPTVMRAPSPPYFDPATYPDPDQGWATSHPNELDGTPTPATQVEDDYRPGDNEPPPGERPVEQDPEDADAVMAALNAQRKSVYDAQRRRMGATDPRTTPKREKLGLHEAIQDGEIVPPGKVRYESRINIVDAFQYKGTLTGAPDWIDRNWAGFGEYDPIRGIDEGPCLRVPSQANPGEVVLARIGDYVCRQSVLLDNGRPPQVRTEVWASEQFERLFVGVDRANASQSVRGITGPGSNLGDMGRRRKPAA